jgi:DNA-binding MarR family transcriptional regulator
MGKSMAFPPQKSMAFQIRRAHLAFDRLLTMRLSKHGIQSGFWHYLRALWIQEGVTQKRLSQITSVTEGTTVALLKAMVKSELVVRQRDHVDKRKVFVKLTTKGRQLENELLPHAIETNQIAARGISHADLAICFAVLEKMAGNLEEEFKSAQTSE